MTPPDGPARCEVCTTRLDPARPYTARRCADHRDQVALFTLDDLSGPARPRRTRRTRPGRATRPASTSKD